MSGAAASLSDAVDKRRCLCSFLLPWNNIWFHHFRPPPNDKPHCHTRALSEGRLTTLSNYCSSSAASRHLRTILPGRQNERIEHVGQVERALKTTATIGKRTNRKKCRRKSMVWTKKGGSLKKIELLGWMLMLSEEKEDMGIGEFCAGVLGSGGYKNPAFAGATQREPG